MTWISSFGDYDISPICCIAWTGSNITLKPQNWILVFLFFPNKTFEKDSSFFAPEDFPFWTGIVHNGFNLGIFSVINFHGFNSFLFALNARLPLQRCIAFRKLKLAGVVFRSSYFVAFSQIILGGLLDSFFETALGLDVAPVLEGDD
jgi:hypothetical protein